MPQEITLPICSALPRDYDGSRLRKNGGITYVHHLSRIVRTQFTLHKKRGAIFIATCSRCASVFLEGPPL